MVSEENQRKILYYSQSLVAFVNAICFICSEKSLSLYFKSKVSFLCLWHFFSSYPVKESKPILWRFSPLLFYRIFHFALWKAAQELLVNWQFIQFYKAHFISTFTISKSFLGEGEPNSIHNQDGFVWVKNSTPWIVLVM